jgi:hypothetical protein
MLRLDKLWDGTMCYLWFTLELCHQVLRSNPWNHCWVILRLNHKNSTIIVLQMCRPCARHVYYLSSTTSATWFPCHVLTTIDVPRCQHCSRSHGFYSPCPSPLPIYQYEPSWPPPPLSATGSRFHTHTSEDMWHKLMPWLVHMTQPKMQIHWQYLSQTQTTRAHINIMFAISPFMCVLLLGVFFSAEGPQDEAIVCKVMLRILFPPKVLKTKTLSKSDNDECRRYSRRTTTSAWGGDEDHAWCWAEEEKTS